MKTFDKILIIIFVLILVFAVIIPCKKAWAYNYNGREYNIVVSENIEYLEYCYFSRTCEVSEYNKKLIKLNILLIKKGFNPLYK